MKDAGGSKSRVVAAGVPACRLFEVAAGSRRSSSAGSRCHGRQGRLPLRSALALGFLVAAIAATSCRRESRNFAPGIELDSPTASYALARDYEDNAYSLSQGKRLFVQFNCVGCHGNGGGGMGPPLLDSPWRYGHELPQIFDSIMDGRPNGMPPFRGRISPQQAWQIAAYVRSMSGQLPRDASPARADAMKNSPPENSVDPVEPTKEPGLRPKAP